MGTVKEIQVAESWVGGVAQVLPEANDKGGVVSAPRLREPRASGV